MAFPVGVAAEESPRYVGAEVCMACHASEHEEWQHSKHAGAFSETFAQYWKRNGEPSACLACHTTGFDPARGTYAFQGVSCEACHGPFQPGHPQSAKMALPTDAEGCMACHKRTYREWQLSGHAKANIRCFDCHAVHRQGLRQANVEAQCGACHAQRLEDFAHATHHLQGLTCTTCHMPSAPDADMIAGANAPAHSFFVGAQTCAACHEEMVHSSHKITSLTQQVVQLAQTPDAQRVEHLGSQVRQLELELDLQRTRTIKLTVIAWLVGLAIGALGVGLGRRRKND